MVARIYQVEKILPRQSAVRALGSVHPSAQEPLNASQCRFLQLYGHSRTHPGEYLSEVQPGNSNKCSYTLLKGEI